MYRVGLLYTPISRLAIRLFPHLLSTAENAMCVALGILVAAQRDTCSALLPLKEAKHNMCEFPKPEALSST